MSETLKALNNIRTLRAQARETDLETLEEPIKVEGDAAYKNFKIEFTAISEGSILQVSELMLRGMFQEAK